MAPIVFAHFTNLLIKVVVRMILYLSSIVSRSSSNSTQLFEKQRDVAQRMPLMLQDALTGFEIGMELSSPVNLCNKLCFSVPPYSKSFIVVCWRQKCSLLATRSALAEQTQFWKKLSCCRCKQFGISVT